MRACEMGLPDVDIKDGVTYKLPAQPKTRDRCRTYMALPFGRARGWAPLSLDANDVGTQEYGLRKRLLRPVPQISDTIITELTEFVRLWCLKNLVPIKDVPSFEEWIQGTPYSLDRRKQLSDWYYRFVGKCPPRRFRRRIDSFIKREAYLEKKAARWINSRHDAFKAWSGRFFHAIEQSIFALPNFVKHMTMSQRIAAIFALEKAGMFYYENDYKAFECHFVARLMKAIECQVYTYLLANYPEEARQICDTIAGKNSLRTRAGIKAKVEALRMSGDMCTSVGNGLTNLILVQYIVAKKTGTVDNGLGALVEGDDGLFASPVELTAEDFANCGFTVEINRITRPSEGHFCGAVLASDGTLLKDPHKILATFGWTHTMIGCGEATAMELLRAKALSLAHEAPQCPIVGALARAALTRTDGYQPRWVDTWKQKLVEDVPLGTYAPSDIARADFARRMGVSTETQILVEDLISKGDLNSICTLISPPRDVEWYSSVYVEVSG